ncbi:MAG: hypothetical protein MUF72_08365 [Elainella sp. Prado103]|jgi:hypothetical protein|nr:hypothetical protein [Elainella sp. Prado103]
MPTSFSLPLPTHLLLSLSTAPLLLVLVGSRALAGALQEIGQTSEEIFRGDRLPVLKISSTQE